MKLDPQQRFELFVAGMLLASEAGREDLLPMLKSAAARAAAELRQYREQTARAARRGGVRRVANRAGQYQ